MAERVVAVRVDAKVSGAVAGLRKVKASVDDLTKADIKKPQKAFDDLATKGALMGGVVALGIGKAVASFAEFDAAMSAVGANSGATGAQLDALREQAIKLGSETQFSATEAAQGINELAKAGVSTAEILNGGLKGALDLAAAGQIGVAQAAETTASALNQFEQDGSQATHVADLLANAANAAQGGVGDMGQALAQAGVAAHAAGLNIDETTTLLALFAKAGLIGSDAGTSLKTMMQRLSAPTEKAAGVMEELGIAAYDAQGNFVGAEALIDSLSTATANMSTEARMAAFNTIFGADAIRAASIAAAAGAKGYKSMATEVTRAGGAAETAAKLTDNLKGDIERLGGSIETAFINAGSAANGGLRDLVKGLGVAVDVIGGLPGPVILATTSLAALALTLPKGISVYRDFVGQLDTMGLSLDKISAKAPRTARALNALKSAGIVTGVAAVAVSIQEVSAASEVADVNVDKLAASLGELAGGGQLQGGIADLFRNEGGLLVAREEFVSTADAIERFNATAFDALSDGTLAATVRMLQPGAEAKFDKYVSQIDAALAQMVSSGNADKAKASLDALINGIDDPQVRDAARAAFTQYDTALKTVADTAVGTTGEVGRLNDEVGRSPGSASSADGALQDMADGGLKAVEDKAKDAKEELQNLLELAESMAGNKRDLASGRAGLANAGDAAIKAAKDRGGNDPEAAAALKEAKADAKEAAAALAKAKRSGTKSQIESAEKAVERTAKAVVAANKRVADSYVDPIKAQREFEESMRQIGERGDSLIHDLIEQKRPISEINTAYRDQRDLLIKAANARGIHGAAAEAEADKVSLTKEQMDDLRWQYANTQAFVDTQVRTPGLPKAKKDVEGYWEVIDGVPTFKETKFSAVTGTALTRIATLKAELAKIPRTIETLVKVRSIQNELKLEANGINSAFSNGGFTGSGGKYEPAGIVHRDEFVLRKEATASLIRAVGMAGLDYMNRTGRMPGTGYANGGLVGASAYRAAPASTFMPTSEPSRGRSTEVSFTQNNYDRAPDPRETSANIVWGLR